MLVSSNHDKGAHGESDNRKTLCLWRELKWNACQAGVVREKRAHVLFFSLFAVNSKQDMRKEIRIVTVTMAACRLGMRNRHV